MTWDTEFARSCRDQQAVKFEEDVVDVLLEHYGLQKRWRSKLLQSHKDKTDTWRLTLDEFRLHFPCFPISLTIGDMRSVRKSHPFSKLISTFESLPLWETFLDGREIHGNPDMPFGLVFKWPYVRDSRGALVLHDLPVDLADHGLRLVFRDEHLEAPVVLETLDGLLAGMDADSEGDTEFWFTTNPGEIYL